MIRLTCLQFRTQAAAAFAALAALAIVLAITGRNLAHLYDIERSSHLQGPRRLRPARRYVPAPLLISAQRARTCHARGPGSDRSLLGSAARRPRTRDRTYRLAWTQSVTRTRWLAVKVALVGLASIAVAGLSSLMITWWFSPIEKVNMNGASQLGGNRFAPGAFSEHGIVPFGYAAFAFAVGLPPDSSTVAPARMRSHSSRSSAPGSP